MQFCQRPLCSVCSQIVTWPAGGTAAAICRAAADVAAAATATADVAAAATAATVATAAADAAAAATNAGKSRPGLPEYLFAVQRLCSWRLT